MTIPEPGEPVLVAVDFTADRLRVMLTDEDGTPVAREQWPLPVLADEDAWAWEVGGRIALLFAREGGRRSALGIGVACPGSVDTATGRLIQTTGQPEWDGLAVADALRRHFGAPVAAVNRVQAALKAETAIGIALDATDALYVSLRGIPSAALMVGGRMGRGASHNAGALPAVPELAPGVPPAEDALQALAGVLADTTALLDPDLLIIEAEKLHLDVIVPLLQRVLDEVAAGPRVVVAALGEDGALSGAVQVASSVAYEGEREA
jgi:predicted NBD/HSP70 family sugar kinase